MMRFFVDFQNKTSNSSTVNNDSVGLAIGRVDTTLDGFARDDLAVKIHVVVTLAEFLDRAVLECPLIVKNELLAVVCRKRNKSNLCVFQKLPPKKIELRSCKCNNPSSLGHLIRHYGTTVHSLR